MEGNPTEADIMCSTLTIIPVIWLLNFNLWQLCDICDLVVWENTNTAHSSCDMSRIIRTTYKNKPSSIMYNIVYGYYRINTVESKWLKHV